MSFSAKIAPSKTIINNPIEIFLAIGSNFIAAFDANLLNIIPSITGTVTIKNILIAILVREMFWETVSEPSKDKDVIIINGTVKTLKRLMTAVNEIEAKDVSIFEVTPPGAAAIIITPIASSGEIGQILTKINAMIGSKIIWLIAPTKKSFGCFKTLKKSAPVNPKPKANIINAKAMGKNISVTMLIKFLK